MKINIRFFSPLFWIKALLFFKKRYELSSVGKNFRFDPFSDILTPKNIKIGNDVYIGPKAHMAAEITIGDRVMIGPHITLLGGNHIFGIKGLYPRYIQPLNKSNAKKINIENDVWIGANVTILKGVTVGTGSVIGAGSVITKDIPPFTIAYGNPAKPTKKIFTDSDLKEHLELLDTPQDKIQKILADLLPFAKLPARKSTQLSTNQYTYKVL